MTVKSLLHRAGEGRKSGVHSSIGNRLRTLHICIPSYFAMAIKTDIKTKWTSVTCHITTQNMNSGTSESRLVVIDSLCYWFFMLLNESIICTSCNTVAMRYWCKSSSWEMRHFLHPLLFPIFLFSPEVQHIHKSQKERERPNERKKKERNNTGYTRTCGYLLINALH